VDIHAAPGSAIIVIGKRRIGLIVVGDKPEISGLTRRLRSNLAATSDLLSSWRWWLARAIAPDDEASSCCELVREVCADLPAAGRVVEAVV